MDLRGDGVDDVIVRLDRAARAYPWAGRYRIWPGPNSNTFTAWLGRAVPELGLDLPPTAIGKDFVEGVRVSVSPGRRGAGFALRPRGRRRGAGGGD